MALDESLDIGLDTRTGVDDSYKLPFQFTGTIDKLTMTIGQEQLAAEDRERMKRALATAHRMVRLWPFRAALLQPNRRNHS
jgi:hypothetical protein